MALGHAVAGLEARHAGGAPIRGDGGALDAQGAAADGADPQAAGIVLDDIVAFAVDARQIAFVAPDVVRTEHGGADAAPVREENAARLGFSGRQADDAGRAGGDRFKSGGSEPLDAAGAAEQETAGRGQQRGELALHGDPRVAFEPRRGQRIGPGNEAEKTVVGKVIQPALVPLEVGGAGVGEAAVPVVEDGGGGTPQHAGGRVVGSDPKAALAILGEGEGGVVRQAVRAVHAGEQAAGRVDDGDAFGFRADGDGAAGQGQARQNRGAPENRVGFRGPRGEGAVTGKPIQPVPAEAEQHGVGAGAEDEARVRGRDLGGGVQRDQRLVPQFVEAGPEPQQQQPVVDDGEPVAGFAGQGPGAHAAPGGAVTQQVPIGREANVAAPDPDIADAAEGPGVGGHEIEQRRETRFAGIGFGDHAELFLVAEVEVAVRSRGEGARERQRHRQDPPGAAVIFHHGELVAEIHEAFRALVRRVELGVGLVFLPRERADERLAAFVVGGEAGRAELQADEQREQQPKVGRKRPAA